MEHTIFLCSFIAAAIVVVIVIVSDASAVVYKGCRFPSSLLLISNLIRFLLEANRIAPPTHTEIKYVQLQ